MPSIFISHASHDRPFTQKLVGRLKAEGIDVWIDEEELGVGDPIAGRIGQAIEKADFFGIVISGASLVSRWVDQELQIAISREIELGRVFILPILLESCRLPPFLAGKKHVDFTTPSGFDTACGRLLKALRGAGQEIQSSLSEKASSPGQGTQAWEWSSRISNFLAFYVGTPEAPATFGGREAEMALLDAWLRDTSAPPFLLYAAPAGRGKSALLAQWIEHLRLDGAAGAAGGEVIFFPISIRYRTNLAGVVFPALATQLARLHGEEVGTGVQPTTEMWRGLFTEYLGRPLPDGRRLLVVLDGLDEAADWNAQADLFPLRPPQSLRVVVTARLTTRHPTARAWLERLGWTLPGLAQTPGLPPLTEEGVASVLRQVGFSLPDPAQHALLVCELHRLSEGDPLLVRLYVDELRRGTPRPAGLTPEELGVLDPGLEGFFDRWWEDQRLLWADDAPLREPAVRTLLNLLACALAPLRQEDLLRLAPDELGTWVLDGALEPLERFVVGDGRVQGYVFAHPRLGQYFYERLAEPERAAWDERFLAWGREVLDALRRDALPSARTPPYLLQYLGVHLERAGAGVGALLALVDLPWLRAWAQSGTGISGFLADAGRAWRTAAREDARAADAGRVPTALGAEVLCALCLASDSSRARKMTSALVQALVELGLWNASEGLVYARRFQSYEGLRSLVRLLPHFPADERLRLLDEALEMAETTRVDNAVLQALCAEWMRLAEPDRAARTGELLRLTESSWISSLERVRALVTIAATLRPEQASAVVQQALSNAQSLVSIVEQANALAVVAPMAPGPAREAAAALMGRAEGAEGAAYGRVCTTLLPVLAPEETVEAVDTLIGRCGLQCCARNVHDARAVALALPDVPGHVRGEISAALCEWVLRARPADAGYAAEILARATPYLPPERRNTLVANAVGVLTRASGTEYLEALDSLLQTLPEPERGAVLTAEVAAARQGLRSRMAPLALLRYDLFSTDRSALVECVRNGTGIVLRDGARTPGLWQRIGPMIRETGIRDAAVQAEIEAELQIGDTARFTATVAVLLPTLSDDRRAEIEQARIRAIIDARHLDPNASDPAWDRTNRHGHVPTAARGGNSERVAVITSVVGALSLSGLRAALSVATSLPSSVEQAAVVAALLRHLPRSAQRRVARRLWRLIVRLPLGAEDAERGWWLRMNASFASERLDSVMSPLLLAVVPHLPPRRKEQAVARLIEIAGRVTGNQRLSLLVRIFPHTAGGQRAVVTADLARALFQRTMDRGASPQYAAARRRIGSLMRGGHADDVLEYARTFPRPDERAWAVASPVPWLDADCRVRVAAEAVTLSRRLLDPAERAELWYGVAVHLPDPALSKALLERAWCEIEGLDETIHALSVLRLSVLIALLPHLSGDERRNKLDAAFELASELASESMVIPAPLIRDLTAQLTSWQVRALIARPTESVRFYPRDQYLEFLLAVRDRVTGDELAEFATRMGYPSSRTRPRLLLALAREVPELLGTEMRLLANHYSSRVGRPRPFADHELPELDSYVEVALGTGTAREGLLTEAARVLERRPRAEQYRVLHQRLHAAAKHSREMVLLLVQSHVAVFASLNVGCLEEVARSMFRVREWWA